MADEGTPAQSSLALDCDSLLGHIQDDSLALAMGVFDGEGNALHVNRGMRLLLGADRNQSEKTPGAAPENGHASGARRAGDSAFRQPSFERLWAATAAGKRFSGLATIGDGLAVNRSVRLTAWRRDERLIAVAEMDVMELDRLNAELFRANREMSNLQRELLKRNRLMEQLAFYDELTGLPNRRLLSDRIITGLKLARRRSQYLAVCFLDLDEFKPINDSLGHAAGDQFLREMAIRLRATVRAEETVARLGGDEFVVVYLLDQPQDLVVALERILAATAHPIRLNERSCSVTASIGATLYPGDEAEPDVLLRHADQAMYQAKQRGRNRFQIFDPAMDREAIAVQQLRARAEQAIDNGELCLQYQPIVDFGAGRVEAVEALVRWHHPERGLLAPADFLPVLEGSELMVKLDDWVLGQVVAQAGRWLASGRRIGINVNLSVHALLTPGFIERLRQRLQGCPGLRPADIQLEIVETKTAVGTDVVGAVVRDCVALGCGVALDDFGTGFSSLSYFRALPAQTLKIDQTFVHDMLEDEDSLRIVEGVIRLAQTFDRRVVAEGVESTAHAILLRRLGCDRGQGYGIARPMFPAQLEPWMEQFRPDPDWTSTGAQRCSAKHISLLLAEPRHRRCFASSMRYLQGDDAGTAFVDEQNCRFGVWLRDEGVPRYAGYAEFAALVSSHHRLHARVSKVVRRRKAGLPVTPADLDALHRASGDLTAELRALQTSILSKLADSDRTEP